MQKLHEAIRVSSRSNLLIILGVFVLCNATVLGQMGCRDEKPKDLKWTEQWIRDEVQWLISPEEIIAFNKLGSIADRESFIRNFWLRRDPDPDTDRNEFLIEYCSRISIASKFTAGIQGFKTDRGRVYLLWGSPDRVEKGKGSFEGLPNTMYEKWVYNYIAHIGSDFAITFIDPSGSNELRFTFEERTRLLPIFDCYNRGLLPTLVPQKTSLCL